MASPRNPRLYYRDMLTLHRRSYGGLCGVWGAMPGTVAAAATYARCNRILPRSYWPADMRRTMAAAMVEALLITLTD